jgi:predicted RNase H-like HicB family nuclease
VSVKTGELLRRLTDDGWYYGAYVPDLPGVISVGDTEEEVVANIRHAIVLHLDGLRQAGSRIPEPRTRVAVVDAA